MFSSWQPKATRSGDTHSTTLINQLSESDVLREICADRQALVAANLDPVGFAYPYGEPGDSGAAAVAACGYGYGRLSGGLAPEPSCAGCPYAEPLGPEKPDAVRAWTPTSDVDLRSLEAAVAGAEVSGGLLTIVFHNVCSPACSAWSIGPDVLRSFAAWLTAEQVSGRISVAGPTDAMRLTSRTSEGPNVLANPSFDSRAGVRRCWTRMRTANVAAPIRITGQGRTGRGVLVVVKKEVLPRKLHLTAPHRQVALCWRAACRWKLESGIDQPPL